MYFKKTSYSAGFIITLLVILLFSVTSSTKAENIYLSPDSLFFISQIGNEFDLQLMVDENIQGMRLYQVYINFDPLMLDTVSTQLGELFATSGFGTFFKVAIVEDEEEEINYLRVEALLLGPTAVVDGPGELAKIRFKILGSGALDMFIFEHTLTDIYNDPIPNTTALGSVVYSDAPPHPFTLISPVSGQQETRLPGDSVKFTWNSTTSPYAGEGVLYNVELSTSSSFVPENTVEFTALPDTFKYVNADDLSNGIYFWRVTAYGDVNGLSTLSDPDWFDYSDGAIDPEPFNLIYPAEDDSVSGLPGESFELTWGKANSVTPGEETYYLLEYGTSTVFHPDSTIVVPDLPDTTYVLYIDDLVQGNYYWRVTAIGNIYGGVTASTPYPGMFRFYYEAVEPEEFDLIAPSHEILYNINNLTDVIFQWEEAVSIIPDDTITYTFYIGLTPSFPGSEWYTSSVENTESIPVLPQDIPWGETLYWRVLATNKYDMETWSTSTYEGLFFYRGDIDLSGEMDIDDLVFFVEYSFLSGPPPEILEVANLNCDADVGDIGDLVFMVEYMFLDGEFPGCM